MTVYKICPKEEWEHFEKRGIYTGSPDDMRDGFIHFSTWEQVPETLKKHFAGKNDLLLIAIDEEQIQSNLKYEASRHGDLFPHLYGQLQLDAVIWVKPVEQAIVDDTP